MFTVQSICTLLDRFAPASLAADWDNVGLLLGDTSTEVHKVMTCLTVTPEVVQEAIDQSVQLIVSHHPIMFRGVKRINSSTPEGRMLWALAKAGIAVYSPHTAFDNTSGGINDFLAQQLGLTDVVPLKRWEARSRYKIVVFVPESDLGRVSDAMFAAGAGVIGEYSQCSFRIAGTGTFCGSEASNPTVGQKGVREQVNEWRLEVVCPESLLDPVISAMRKAHSYEEPAFDVYPLRVPLTGGGEGRVGRLPEPVSLELLARNAKELFCVPVLAYQGDPGRTIHKVAIVCGAGGDFIQQAVRARADLLVTGEVRFHETLNALSQNLSLILPGHYASERLAVEALAIMLRDQFPGLTIWPSQAERDPFRWV